MRPAAIVLFCSIFLFSAGAEARGKSAPHSYGSVIIRNFSQKPALPSVRFDHWLHRALYTCRLCHVDIGFAMEANASGITAEMNQKGLFCGACHNGARVYESRPIFASCSVDPTIGEKQQCDRCHSEGSSPSKKYHYETFAARLPKQLPSNLINWEEAEAKGLIHPVDFLEGVSMQRKRLSDQQDFAIKSKSDWMPDIIFSHKKHTVWNGCEVCHPEIFPSTRKGTVKYTMLDISDGQYCGLCHNAVAFPLSECSKCHAEQTFR